MADTTDDTRPIADHEIGSIVDDRGTNPDTDYLFDSYLDVSGSGYRPAEERQLRFMLRADGKIRKLENALSLPIRSAEWRIDPPSEDHGQTVFVQDVLTRPANNGGMSTPFGTVIGQMTSAFLYRVAMFEKVWTVRDGQWVYDKVGFRQATNTKILRDKITGSFQGLRQPPLPGRTDPRIIEPKYSFAYIHGAHREPLIGTSEFDVAWLCFTTKQKLKYLWFQWLGTQVVPKTVVTEAGGTGPIAGSGSAEPSSGAKRGAKAMASLPMGASAALAPGLTVTSLDSSGTAGAAWMEAFHYLDAEIADSMLAGFTDLASAAASGAGSYALSRDQHDFFLMGETAIANDMAAFINNYLIADLVRWNFGPAAQPPTFVFEDLAGPATDQLVGLISTFGVGHVPDEFVEQLVLRTSDMLGIDTGKVARGFKRAAAAAKAQANSAQEAGAAGVAGAANVATAATQQATGVAPPPGAAADDPATVLAAAGLG